MSTGFTLRYTLPSGFSTLERFVTEAEALERYYALTARPEALTGFTIVGPTASTTYTPKESEL